MLSLKQSLSLSSCKGLGGEFEPTDINSLQLWYKNLLGMENVAGDTDADDFVTGDLIKWQSQVGSNLLYNDQNWNRPLWGETKMAININGNRFYELDTNLTISGDFTMCFSIRFENTPATDGILGSGNTNLFEAEDNNTFAFRAGGTSEISITHASKTLSPYVWYTIILTRESGTVSVYVDGGSITNTLWGTGTDSDTLTVETIGSWNGDNHNLDGFIRDISYFNEAITSSERSNMIAYINNY